MSFVRYIMRRFGRGVAFAGLVVWAFGSCLSFLGLEGALFQRFGALGVAASVLFFSDRLLKIELDRQRSVERMLHEFGVEMAALKSGTAATDIPDQGYVVDVLTEESNFDQLRQKADLFNVANVTLMTASTLQWGFGDYFLTWAQAKGFV